MNLALVEYREGSTALPVADFVELTRRVWGRELDAMRLAEALARTLNVGAWHDGQLVGAVRVLSDGYLFSTIPEVMVDPACRHQGIGRELMYRALKLAPGGDCSLELSQATSRSLNGLGLPEVRRDLWVASRRCAT